MKVGCSSNGFLDLVSQAHDIGIKLEFIAGIPTWEAPYTILHQRSIDRIRKSIRPSEARPLTQFVEEYNVEILFPDGSFSTPDISIWDREPVEHDEPVTLIPQAIIQVLAERYQRKDTEISAPFYLSMGVKDVILFDPSTGSVEHRRMSGNRMLTSPVKIELECGCVCTV